MFDVLFRVEKFRCAFVFCVAACLLASGCGGERRVVSVASEVAALTNLMVFCEPPQGVSGMESTYDRRGGNADWWDVPKPISGRADLYEMIHVTGPGCIKRIWETNMPVTEWQIFFDDEPQPRLVAPTIFPMPGIADAPMCGGASGGAYSYLPMPFAKSIRIVVRMPDLPSNARPYFHVNYERYPNGTAVETWPAKNTAALSNLLVSANAAWRNVATADAAVLEKMKWQRVTVLSHQSVDLFAHQGGGIVTALAVRPDFTGKNPAWQSLLLRGLVLECRWDGAQEPSVKVPMGDFFCNGLHARDFAAMPMACIHGLYLCRLPMPFRSEGRITIRNDSPVEMALDTAADFAPGDVGDRLYLHAAFNAAISSGVPMPFHVMHTTGRGKYVGCYLTSLGMDGSWNILEGNEYFYRDGESTWTHKGTGLEDYFNAGWYYFGLFDLPLHGLLEKAAMRTAQYRFHLNDPVTFRKDLRMEWEFGDGNTAGGYLSAASYWYQDKPGPAGSTIPTLERRFPPVERVGLLTIMDELFELERMGLIENAAQRSEYYANALPEALQSERWFFHLRALAYTEMLHGYGSVAAAYAAMTTATNVPPEVVHQAKLLLWRGQQPGRAIFGAHGYADYQLLVDGTTVGKGSGPFVWMAWPVELAPGEHVLQAEITPQQPQAFISLGFSSFFTNIVSDTSWDYARERPAGWPATTGPREAWHPYETLPGFFPTMAWWRFAPNAIPCVQSGQQQGGPYGEWTQTAGRTVYLRRRIVVPAQCADRPPMPPRLTQMPSAAMRPKDDTSNEGVSHQAHP
jgi:hypothetical protein